MNHRARRTHLSHNRLLEESCGARWRAARTQGGGGGMFEMTYLMITTMAAAVLIGGGVVGLGHTGWMDASVRCKLLNEEAYGCMRTSAHFMNI